jgi:hypothetical protein
LQTDHDRLDRIYAVAFDALMAPLVPYLHRTLRR